MSDRWERERIAAEERIRQAQADQRLIMWIGGIAIVLMLAAVLAVVVAIIAGIVVTIR